MFAGGQTMQCPQCGSPNAPGQEVCSRCGYPLLSARGDFGGGNEPPAWREEWPALGGSPAQAPLPPWLASNDSAPASRMPSSPFTPAPTNQQNNSWANERNGQSGRPNSGGNGQYGGPPQYPSGQGNAWDAPPAAPASGPFSSDYPPQYPSYYGPASGEPGQRGLQPAPQQMPGAMPPMFMVNPPDLYPPDSGPLDMAPYSPYGLPPDGMPSAPGPGLTIPPPAHEAPMSVRPTLAMTPTLTPGAALKNGRYRIIQRFSSGSASGDTEPPLMIATDTELPSERVLVQELPLGAMHPADAEYIRHNIAERLEAIAQAPGIAHLRDNFVEQRRHFLVFELPSGDRLLDRLRRAHGPLPETTVISIILQILDVLQTLQNSAVPVIHGNITPANILLRPGGQVALVGFSPTLLIYPTGQSPNGPAGALSHYSAPEQARGSADVRSDLYAVCAVMHHAVTGVEPVGRMFPLARHANPAVSLELEDILGQGLRPSSSQRFQTPEDLREALAPLASGKRLTHVDEELDPSSPTGLRPLRDAQGRLMGPRQRVTQNPLFFVGIVLLLVALLGGGVLYNTMRGRATTSTTPSQTISSAFAPYYQESGIGLSGGEFVFDTEQPDYALKQKGALALAAGDIHGALDAYQQAVTSQPNDVEALIYAADLQILAKNDPYITVIAGVAFDSDTAGPGDLNADAEARYEMQGIYLAQQRFNQAASNNPGHLHLRVLILNSGGSASDTQRAVSLMLDQVRNGNVQHIVGVIGWPESEQTRQAMNALAAAGLPVISPSASPNNIQDIASNFYSLAPSDAQQASDLADAAVNNLQTQRILVVYDPNNPQGSGMATAFSNRIKAKDDSTTTLLGQMPYDGASVRDATGFRQIAATAIAQNADLIYLVGDQHAAILLADAVSQQAALTYRQAPHVLVGPQTVMAPFFGVGPDPASLAARANRDALGLLYVATLADLSQWQVLNMAPPDARTFSDSFSTLFKGFWGAGGLSQPGALAILAYDATNMLLSAVTKNIQTTKTGVTIPTAHQITIALGAFTASQPFVGLGGAVAFSTTAHQPNKALGIYQLLPIPNAPENAPVVQLQLLTVVGGKALFCGQSPCKPY